MVVFAYNVLVSCHGGSGHIKKEKGKDKMKKILQCSMCIVLGALMLWAITSGWLV